MACALGHPCWLTEPFLILLTQMGELQLQVGACRTGDLHGTLALFLADSPFLPHFLASSVCHRLLPG